MVGIWKMIHYILHRKKIAISAPFAAIKKTIPYPMKAIPRLDGVASNGSTPAQFFCTEFP
jgi:hypothetical protein